LEGENVPIVAAIHLFPSYKKLTLDPEDHLLMPQILLTSFLPKEWPLLNRVFHPTPLQRVVHLAEEARAKRDNWE